LKVTFAYAFAVIKNQAIEVDEEVFVVAGHSLWSVGEEHELLFGLQEVGEGGGGVGVGVDEIVFEDSECIVRPLVECPLGDKEPIDIVVEGVTFDARGHFHEVIKDGFGTGHEGVDDVNDVGLFPLDCDSDLRGL
jgi:hypothetical protein